MMGARMPRTKRPQRAWVLLPALAFLMIGLTQCALLDSSSSSGPSGSAVETVIADLDTVWELAWSDDGRLFLTERKGQLSVWKGEELTRLLSLPVVEQGESGLMGMALDPDFPATPFVYVCYTADRMGSLQNVVERLRVADGTAERDQVILDGMDAARIHDGCRLGFGPNGKLLVTMGDAADASVAQDRDALNGKVLRINPDGSVPDDNPFPSSPVFTLGHRNPQGLDVRPGTDEIYISEHGPASNDEINRLVSGANYGWPEVGGTTETPQYEPALWSWTPTIAPAGIAFTDAQTLYLATLKASELHRLTLSPDGAITGDEVVLDGFGRLRALTLGTDGDCLYLGTSNRDGRGRPASRDDRVLRYCP